MARPHLTTLALVPLLVLSGCDAAMGGTSCDPPCPSAPPAARSPEPARGSEVSVDRAMVHLRALQAIADRNGGNRAASRPGYEASVDYVVGTLRAGGYDVDTPAYDAQDGTSRTLRNVIAQTRTGDPGSVVVIGAHLDSVPDGPGVVDNGSGVATLLEIADRLGPRPALRRSVRFAFFGSEEEGGIGSTAYVDGLSAAERRAIVLYLNVDMVASSNGGYFVQGGKGDDRSESGPPGSAAVAAVLAAELAKTGVEPETTEFVGDDEVPFVEAGIPSAGAENGDRRKKSRDQARAWGGRAGQAFDPCYHSGCDDLSNVNEVVLGHYLRAIAGTVGHFATSDDTPRG